MTLPAVLQGRLRLPVIGAPMFRVSVPDLVIAQCKAGIVGSFPALNALRSGTIEHFVIARAHFAHGLCRLSLGKGFFEFSS
jgi:nitronate monooxygenase